jgi:hypothetical protein
MVLQQSGGIKISRTIKCENARNWLPAFLRTADRDACNKDQHSSDNHLKGS